MRTVTKPRPIEPACSFDTFLSVLNNPAPAFAATPRTLRNHVGARQFGDFGAVLLAERPASADLSDRVARWREIDTTTRDDVPLRARAGQTASERRLQFALAVTSGTLGGWIVIGIVVAFITGKL